MDYVRQFGELKKYFEKADFTDVKVFEGDASLRKFIASMLSYYPWWIVQLYRIRKLLVGILGLVKHEAPEELPNLQPEDVSFTPGENVIFFTVRSAQEDGFWISETPDDKHLRAYFGVVKEPVSDSINRFYVITTVFYKHWTGPVYFNIIRPFHHLVVSRMAGYGLTHRKFSENRRKGHYLGTEIEEKWWKRYRKDRFFARGNGEYWYDDTALYFRRYLTKHFIQIPFSKIIEVKIGKSHAGRWLFGSRVLKVIWEQDGTRLSSGFVVSRYQKETETVMADLMRRFSFRNQHMQGVTKGEAKQA